ncbi:MULTISPECIES: hypothetical protein [unclassified Campylobacter]|uniref:hypothetical protein n=1 Tax=unclassified Campylobacter TaxID=2593542 RepID=UPI003D326FC0
MRRNSSDLQIIGYALGVLALFVYEIATTIFIFLPPLIGLFFTYMVLEYARWQKSYTELGFGWYLSIAFLLFAEQVNGFYLFSSIVAFFVFFYFMVDWLFATLKHRKFLLVIFVSAGYLGTYGVSNLINYMLNLPSMYLSYEYVAFIVVESFLAFVFLRERVT